jgi:hypothetical protein
MRRLFRPADWLNADFGVDVNATLSSRRAASIPSDLGRALRRTEQHDCNRLWVVTRPISESAQDRAQRT